MKFIKTIGIAWLFSGTLFMAPRNAIGWLTKTNAAKEPW